MRVERDTTHKALHAAGAVTVRQISPGVFDVDPDIDVAVLDGIEAQQKTARLLERIANRAQAEREKPITVTIDAAAHKLPVSVVAQILTTGAAFKADRAKRALEPWARKLPTDLGFPTVNADKMLAIFDQVEERVAAAIDRHEELVGMVEAGTFTEADLETGWPE